ncbi:MAG: serine/threonine-protein kinase [Gemmatimonadales bacterium]
MIADRELWQRARPVFDELVELDHSLRLKRLEEIGRADPHLREVVEWLLSADATAEDALRDYRFGTPRDLSTRTTASRDPLGLVGRTVSHFRVIGHLASGGMGAVYTAEDLSLGRTVALKFPLPHQPLDGPVRERFVNEARSAAALDHPNLCTVHEIGDSEHGVFLAMPLYPGETLKERLAREGALPCADALGILRQVTTGLASAHAAGIVHRDLKPANVMLLPDGTAKILDFGLAKVRDVSLTKSHMTLGTIGYIAPEQIRSAPVDARADLWAMGVMLYETLTGTLPFRGEHEISILNAVLHEDPPRPSDVNQALSPEVDTLIGALLEKDPANRYQSAGDLLADLEAIQHGTPLAFRRSFWNRSRRRRQMRRAILPGTALLLVAIAGVSWGLYRLTATGEQPAAAAGVADLRWRDNTTEIGTAAELAAALVPAHAGRRVRLRAGIYDVDQLLTVPDSMTLEGAGVMRYDPDGLPTGFEDGTRTTLRMIASIGGDMLTLGDGVTVQQLEIVDLAGRSGNVVAVGSRRPRDHISTTILESVIVNPSPLTVGGGGPLGRGLSVITRNLNLGADPPPDNGSVLSVRMIRSIIQSPAGGGGFFAYNFTADSRIVLDIASSVIGGSNEANGGVSRPEPVHDSEVRIESRGNLYRNEWADPCASALLGWNFTGGSGAPIPIPLAETRRNTLRVRSTNDRIEGFTTAVHATGSRRFYAAPLNPAPSGNHIDLQLIGTTISTPSCADVGINANTSGVAAARRGGVADLSLTGAWVENTALAPGDSNTLRVEFRGVTGSGQRANKYLHAGGAAGELSVRNRGSGNWLMLIGSPEAFVRDNRGLTPAPASTFFTMPR